MKEIFNKLAKQTVLIIGDVMIDSYLWGNVDRISPEAPVPILSVTKRENRLGGAANVALNILAMGAKPIICSVIGNDGHATTFDSLLNDQNISNAGIIKSDNRVTTVKTRLIGHHQQMLRVDSEVIKDITKTETEQLIGKVAQIIDIEKVDAIIFEDYDKGVITHKLIEEIVELAQERNIPTIVDPKKKNFLHYKNVTLFKPNLKELREGLKVDIDAKDHHQLVDAIELLKHKLNASMVMVTLSEQGIYINSAEEKMLIPAHIRDISDVSGAGDTVVSVAALGLAAGLKPSQFTALANLAGGLVCEKLGVVPVDKMQLLEEAKKHKI
ncbi:bifunctional heptose 7-phosphate kinase/heptose 1-phosphate adenyltransferase [Solitalea lacus]|uniref:bifunctional heptose 7-phosphate kinase/heptose 1-phosphate adenyltransferase n=1 Tax=Solitalea lacus TaxID=2911172 RepID=UPI001EDB3C2C|nr:bifunctional ADP-heptose synthase [Solitalea lacus]UKJ06101.1 bifunctional ADP-heptose synthase [Solitalea lacus]